MNEENKKPNEKESNGAPFLRGEIKTIRRLAKHQVRQIDSTAERVAYVEREIAIFQARVMKSLNQLEEKMKRRQGRALGMVVALFLIRLVVLWVYGY